MDYNTAELNDLKNRNEKYLIIIMRNVFSSLIHMKNNESFRNILQYFYRFNYIYF
ncbi:hypothetical protein EKTHUN627_25610 [Enterobacter kobei]|nr:hypothetical protein AC520_2366 [Enterobacter sp. OLF]GHS71762.1 hypothetical protein EKTHUN627_25610 [Enterobacter kobei]